MRYNQQLRKVFYQSVDNGRLNGYLADDDREAEHCFRLVRAMAEVKGITEKLKAEHPMEWIEQRECAREADAKIVNAKK